MKLLVTIIALLLVAPLTRALCPRAETVSADTEPPVVSLARTERFYETAIVVRAKQPVCLVFLELVAQGSGLTNAALLGPSMTRGALPRRSGAGLVRFTFLVETWLPAGETRYVVWFPVGPWYLALDPGLVLWFRQGDAALPARIENGTIGAVRPVKRPAPPSKKRVRAPAKAKKPVPKTKTRKRR